MRARRPRTTGVSDSARASHLACSGQNVGVSFTLAPTVMLARGEETLPVAPGSGSEWAYEPKWDGFRGVVCVAADGCRIWTRQGIDVTRCFPEIAEAALRQLPSGSVLDGELVVWGEGRLDFGALQRRVVAPGRSGVLFRLAGVDGRPIWKILLGAIKRAVELSENERHSSAARRVCA